MRKPFCYFWRVTSRRKEYPPVIKTVKKVSIIYWERNEKPFLQTIKDRKE